MAVLFLEEETLWSGVEDVFSSFSRENEQDQLSWEGFLDFYEISFLEAPTKVQQEFLRRGLELSPSQVASFFFFHSYSQHYFF